MDSNQRECKSPTNSGGTIRSTSYKWQQYHSYACRTDSNWRL